MTVSTPRSGRAAELRRDFDSAFAAPPPDRVARFDDLLAIRAGGVPFALRLRQVAGLFADRAITPIPSALSELLGIAGFRGEMVPVYDLRALLGYPGAAPPRWLALVASASPAAGLAAPLALAFEAFEGHLRVSPDAIAAETRSDRGPHVHEVVRVDGVTRSIVQVASLFDAITTRVRQNEERSSQKER